MKTYCELYYPGSFFAEEELIEVKTRNPKAIAKKYPNAFAFLFFDQVKQEVEVDGVKRVGRLSTAFKLVLAFALLVVVYALMAMEASR